MVNLAVLACVSRTITFLRKNVHPRENSGSPMVVDSTYINFNVFFVFVTGQILSAVYRLHASNKKPFISLAVPVLYNERL